MKRLSMFGVGWDAWQATRGGKEAILERQQARLRDIVAYARQHSRFYAEHYRDLPETITDVTQLPRVSKPQLMARFEDWLTDPAIRRADVDAFLADMSNIGTWFQGKYLVWTTSGTTGAPAILMHDRNWFAVQGGLSLARLIPVYLSMSMLGKIIRGGRRMAAVFSTAGHYLGVTMAERQRRSSRARQRAIRVFSALMPLPELRQELNAFQPVMISGYATALTLLAKEQLAGRLHIAPVMVSSSGETLNDGMREVIQQAWNTTAWNSYSSSETGVMAQQCRYGRLHLNSDWYIVEAVDEHYQPVPPGTRSARVLVSNLVTGIAPILRYEMSDSLTFDPDVCACGSPLPVIRVEGRTDSILEVTAPDGVRVNILPLALSTVVEEVPGVYRFQIVQTSPSALQVRLEPAPGTDRDALWPEVQRRLDAFLSRQGAPGVALSLAHEPPQQHPRSGKLRHVLTLGETA